MSQIQDHIGTYQTNMDVAFAGMMGETSGPKDVASRTIENADVAIGLAVGKGAADRSARLGGAGYEGITTSDKSRESDAFKVGEVGAVMRKGSIWVTASTDVSPSDPVTFTPATGVIGAGLATTIDSAKFETSATSGNLVLVYLG